MKNIWSAMSFLAIVLVSPALAGDMHQGHGGPKIYFISPKDGDTVKSPVHVIFGLTGMGIAPAGVEKENTGHHHLLIDVPLPTGEELADAIGKDEQRLHFGGGQTEAMIDLKPGKHTLQMLLGDHNHMVHKTPVYSERITITVE